MIKLYNKSQLHFFFASVFIASCLSTNLLAQSNPPSPTLQISYFVDSQDGRDSSQGTIDQPLKTLAKALSKLQGQTAIDAKIYLKPRSIPYAFLNTTIDGMNLSTFSIQSYSSNSSSPELPVIVLRGNTSFAQMNLSFNGISFQNDISNVYGQIYLVSANVIVGYSQIEMKAYALNISDSLALFHAINSAVTFQSLSFNITFDSKCFEGTDSVLALENTRIIYTSQYGLSYSNFMLFESDLELKGMNFTTHFVDGPQPTGISNPESAIFGLHGTNINVKNSLYSSTILFPIKFISVNDPKTVTVDTFSIVNSIISSSLFELTGAYSNATTVNFSRITFGNNFIAIQNAFGLQCDAIICLYTWKLTLAISHVIIKNNTAVDLGGASKFSIIHVNNEAESLISVSQVSFFNNMIQNCLIDLDKMMVTKTNTIIEKVDVFNNTLFENLLNFKLSQNLIRYSQKPMIPLSLRNINITNNLVKGTNLINLSKEASERDNSTILALNFCNISHLNLVDNVFQRSEKAAGNTSSVITSYNLGLRVTNSSFLSNWMNGTNLIELSDQMVTVVLANSSFVGVLSDSYLTTGLFYKKQMDFNRNLMMDQDNSRYVPNFGAFCLLDNTFRGVWRLFDGQTVFNLNVASFFIHKNIFLSAQLEGQVVFGVSNIVALKPSDKPMKILLSPDEKQITDPYLQDPLLLELFEKAIFENAKTDENQTISCVFSFSGNQFHEVNMKLDSLFQISTSIPDTLIDVSNNVFVGITGSQKSSKYDSINIFDFSLSPYVYLGNNTFEKSSADLLFVKIGESLNNQSKVVIFNNTFEQNAFIPFIGVTTHSPLSLNISENKIKNCTFQQSPAVHFDFKQGNSTVYILGNSFENNTVFTEGFVQTGLIVFEAQKETNVPVIFGGNSIIRNSFVSQGINPLSLAYKNSLFYFMNVNSTVTFKKSAFLLNSADTNTFFVVIYSKTVTLDYLNLTEQGSNQGTFTDRPAASIYISTQNLTVANSLFQDNTAQIGAAFALDFLFKTVNKINESLNPIKKLENTPEYLYLRVRNTTFQNNKVETGGAIHINYVSKSPLVGEIRDCHFVSNLAETGPALYVSTIAISALLLSDNEFNCSVDTSTIGLTGRLLYFSQLSNVSESFDQSIRILNSKITLHRDLMQNGDLIEMKNIDPLVFMQNLTFFHDRNSSNDDTNSLTIIKIASSTVSLTDVHFRNFHINTPLIILNQNAKVSVNASTFIDLVLDEVSSVFALQDGGHMTLSVTYCSFSRFSYGIYSDPSAIRVFVKGTNLYINSTNFTELGRGELSGTAIKATMKIFEESLGKMTIENSIFSMTSGAITHEGGILWINNCKFINNSRRLGGAIIARSLMSMGLTNNHFENNSAFAISNTESSQISLGGAVYIVVNDASSKLLITSNTFVNNSVIGKDILPESVSGGGGAIYLDLIAIPAAGSELEKAILNIPSLNHFSNNSASSGPDYVTSPVSMTFQSYSSGWSLTHECLTSPCQFHVQAWTDIFRDNYLILYFLDFFRQRLLPFYEENLPSDYKMSLQITNQPQPSYSADCTIWLCIINGNEVNIKGYANQPLNFTFSVSHPSYPSINFTIMTSMRECQLGEINDTSRLTCSPCEKGSYSMNKSDTTCSPCPDNAFCPGGYQVIPKKGYWKPNIYSTNIYLCNNSDVCDAMTYGERACAPGYKGPFCLACELENGYASSGTGCAKCPPFWQGMLILCSLQLLIFAIEIAYIWYFRKINKSMIVGNKFSKKSVDRVSRGGYMTIMMDYLQIITILKGYPLVVSGFLAALSHIGNPSQTLLYSSDCVFLQVGFSPENVFYAKLVSIVLLPFVKLFLCMIFGFVKKFAYTHFRFNDYIIVAIQCLVLVEQPSMLSALLSAINCQSIDPKAPDQSKVEYFLKENPEVTCYTNAYNSYRNIMALPMLVFWGICLPVILAAALIYNRNRLKTYSFATKFGIQYAIYRSKMYFWNLIQLLNKFILIFFAQSSFLPLNMLGLTLFLILIGYMLIIKQFQPYRSVDLQKTYIRSIYVFIFTIFAAVYGYEESQLDKVISSFIILLNAAFIIFIAIKLLHLFGYRWITRSLNNLFNKVFHNKDGNKNYFFDDSYHNLTDSVLHPDHPRDHLDQPTGIKELPQELSGSVNIVPESHFVVHQKAPEYIKMDGLASK